MSPQPGLPSTAAAAMQQQRYADAIPILEAFCQQCAGSPSKDYFQAQMWLVKAYKETARTKRAIELCQQMLTVEHLKIQSWAQQALSSLTSVSDEQQNAAPIEASNSPESTPTRPTLTAEESKSFLDAGNKALKQGRYDVAIENLAAYCIGTDSSDKDYEQAQTWLAKAYKGNGQKDQAVILCQKLIHSKKPFIKIWAEQFLQSIAPEAVRLASTESNPEISTQPEVNSTSRSSNRKATSAAPQSMPKAGRSAKRGVTLLMKGVASNLALASGVTLSLLFGMVLVLSLNLLLITDSANPMMGMILAIGITIVFNTIVFFLSPVLMDIIQGILYGTRWASLSEVERYSPEAARTIRLVCQQKKIKEPRIGIIEDQNPTAFTYGSLPNTARIVVSRGLFTYLDDDEVATVYAHELGHIVHWDFAVMTLAATLVQITYLIYVGTREVSERLGDSDVAKKIKSGTQSASLTAYLFYIIGEYLLLYLSRTREYYADHFAAEVTGNPNGLSRALVKIAYGILEEGQRSQKPSNMLQGTRALGISDPRSATFTGTAYRVAAEPQKVGRVFLWDMFNPWAWWMELNSTHPLTGKRIRALTNYAEQLGLEAEFDMARVVNEGRHLNRRKLYGNFAFDILIYWADWLGLVLGLFLGGLIVTTVAAPSTVIFSLALLLFGTGTLVKTFVMYPSFNRATATDVLSLMSDPYASPLRGQPVKLTGKVIGRGDAGYRFGSDLKLQDQAGMVYLRYNSRFGPIGNFFFGASQAESFVRQEVTAIGWFRRGVMPWVDLVKMNCPAKWNVDSYHRFWSLMVGIGAIVLSFALPNLIASI